MNRSRSTHPVSIGNGLFAQTRTGVSLLDAYRAKQRSCAHVKRDPRGMCYDCGQRAELVGALSELTDAERQPNTLCCTCARNPAWKLVRVANGSRQTICEPCHTANQTIRTESTVPQPERTR